MNHSSPAQTGESAPVAPGASAGGATVRESEEGASTENTASTGDTLRARLSPWAGRGGDPDAVHITVYVVTGEHGKLRVPESFCRECHMFTRRAQQAIEQVDTDVTLSVRSWWTQFPWALRHGGYHPPVMIVGGKRLCQGHDVPTTAEIVDAIERARNRRE
jgi:hypothetical protein